MIKRIAKYTMFSMIGFTIALLTINLLEFSNKMFNTFLLEYGILPASFLFMMFLGGLMASVILIPRLLITLVFDIMEYFKAKKGAKK